MDKPHLGHFTEYVSKETDLRDRPWGTTPLRWGHAVMHQHTTKCHRMMLDPSPPELLSFDSVPSCCSLTT